MTRTLSRKSIILASILLLAFLAGCVESESDWKEVESGPDTEGHTPQTFTAIYLNDDQEQTANQERTLTLRDPMTILSPDGQHRLAYPLNVKVKGDAEPAGNTYWLDGDFRTVRLDRLCFPAVTEVCDYAGVHWSRAGPPNPWGVNLPRNLSAGNLEYSWAGKSIPVEYNTQSNNTSITYEFASITETPTSPYRGSILSATGTSFTYEESMFVPFSARGVSSFDEDWVLKDLELGSALEPIPSWPDFLIKPKPAPREGPLFPGAAKVHPDLGYAPAEILEKIREIDSDASHRLESGQCIMQFSLRLPTWQSDFLGRDHRTQVFTASIADDSRAENVQLVQRTDSITADETWESNWSQAFSTSCAEGNRSPWPIVAFDEAIEVLKEIKVSGTPIAYAGTRTGTDIVAFEPEHGWDRYRITYSTDWAEGRDEVDLFAVSYKVMMNANTGGFHEARIHPDDVLRMDGR